MTSPCNDSVTYAPVLERMVELLGATGHDKLTIGEALKQASRELRIPVPAYMEESLLVSAFKVIAGGRIPGAPDA